jgi:hypothetical protein
MSFPSSLERLTFLPQFCLISKKTGHEYQATSANHRSLAELGATAARAAKNLVNTTELPSSLARQRGLVRNALAEITKDIDKLVKDVIW